MSSYVLARVILVNFRSMESTFLKFVRDKFFCTTESFLDLWILKEIE